MKTLKFYKIVMSIGIIFLALSAAVSILLSHYLDAVCNIVYVTIAAINYKLISLIVKLKHKAKDPASSAEMNDQISFHNQPEQE